MTRRFRTALLALTGALVAGGAPSTASQAAVINCFGIGVTTGNIQYGECNTDATSGKGSVRFSHDPLTVSLAADSRNGPEEVAAFWESNGPVDVSDGAICVTVRVVTLTLTRGATSEQHLDLSYNFAPHTLVFPTVRGTSTYCGPIPAGATNVFWQLLTTAGGSSPASRAHVRETLISVS